MGKGTKIRRMAILGLVCVWLLPDAVRAAADNLRLSNGRIGLSLSTDGRRFELGFANEAASLSGDRGLFDMMVAVGSRHEWGIDPGAQAAEVTRDGDALVARYAQLHHAGVANDVSIELRFTLE